MVVVNQNDYQVFYYADTNEAYETLKVWPAFRWRVEAGWEEIESKIREYDTYLEKKGYQNKDNKYCNIKQIIVEDDYLIIDIFAKKEKKKVEGSYKK